MNKIDPAEDSYNLTEEISKTIFQLGVNGDPVALQNRLTELNRQQIEHVRKNFLHGDHCNTPSKQTEEQPQSTQDASIFSPQKSLLERIFNRN